MVHTFTKYNGSVVGSGPHGEYYSDAELEWMFKRVAEPLVYDDEPVEQKPPQVPAAGISREEFLTGLAAVVSAIQKLPAPVVNVSPRVELEAYDEERTQQVLREETGTMAGSKIVGTKTTIRRIPKQD